MYLVSVEVTRVEATSKWEAMRKVQQAIDAADSGFGIGLQFGSWAAVDAEEDEE